jgi:hypothetical protein
MANPMTTAPQKEMISIVPMIGLPKILITTSVKVTTIIKASVRPAMM